MRIKASNNNVWVIRHDIQKVVGGVIVPPSAQKKTHKGDIVSVGKLVSDDTISEGRVAIFNKSAGFEIEEDNVSYTILTQIDIVGTDDKNSK